MSKLITYDLKYSIWSKWPWLLLSFFVTLIGCVSFIAIYTPMREYEAVEFGRHWQITLGDFLFYVLGGSREYTLSELTNFTFPAVWMAIYTIHAYAAFDWFAKDLRGMGQHILLHSKRRTIWWISKCVSNITLTVLSFFVMLGIIFLFAGWSGAEFSLNISSPIYKLLFVVEADTIPPYALICALLLSLLVCIAISLLEQTLCLFMKPIFSFMIAMGVLLASTYKKTGFLIGNFLMLSRNGDLVLDGISVAFGYVLACSTIIGSLLVGTWLFKRYNILERGREF